MQEKVLPSCSEHKGVTTKPQGLKIGCFIRINDSDAGIILSYKCQLQN